MKVGDSIHFILAIVNKLSSLGREATILVSGTKTAGKGLLSHVSTHQVSGA